MANLWGDGQGSPDRDRQRHYPDFESINFTIQNKTWLRQLVKIT